MKKNLKAHLKPVDAWDVDDHVDHVGAQLVGLPVKLHVTNYKYNLQRKK